MQYTLNIQKALSVPHCTKVFFDGDKSYCAIGAIANALEDGAGLKEYAPNLWMMSTLGTDVLLKIPRITEYAIRNNTADTDLERDLIRREMITELIAKGIVKPRDEDLELSKELNKELSCQLV